nr:deoxycytidine triphosphate deaminase [Stigmatella aurantiaca]
MIEPFQEARVKSAAYELSVGAEVFRTSTEPAVKTMLVPGAQFEIPPGQLALLITEEVIRIPPDAIGFISIRAGIKFRGLVNVSGFHVDPGFHGRLKFTVYNAGSRSVVVARGTPIFLLWFSSLNQPTADLHKGDHSGQMEITAEDVMRLSGDTASPADLKLKLDDLRLDYDKRIHALETNQTLARRLLIGLIGAVVVGAAGLIIKESLLPSSQPTVSSGSAVTNPAPASPPPSPPPASLPDAGSPP